MKTTSTRLFLLAFLLCVINNINAQKSNYSEYLSRELSAYLFLANNNQELKQWNYLTNGTFGHLSSIKRGNSFIAVFAFYSLLDYKEGFPNILYDITIFNPSGKIYFAYSNFREWLKKQYLANLSCAKETQKILTKVNNLLGKYKVVVNFKEVISGHCGTMNLFFELTE